MDTVSSGPTIRDDGREVIVTKTSRIPRHPVPRSHRFSRERAGVRDRSRGATRRRRDRRFAFDILHPPEPRVPSFLDSEGSFGDRGSTESVARHPQLQVGMRANPRWVTDAPMRSRNSDQSRGAELSSVVTDAPMRSRNLNRFPKRWTRQRYRCTRGLETARVRPSRPSWTRYGCTYVVSKLRGWQHPAVSGRVSDAPMWSRNYVGDNTYSHVAVVPDVPMRSRNELSDRDFSDEREVSDAPTWSRNGEEALFPTRTVCSGCTARSRNQSTWKGCKMDHTVPDAPMRSRNTVHGKELIRRTAVTDAPRGLKTLREPSRRYCTIRFRMHREVSKRTGRRMT